MYRSSVMYVCVTLCTLCCGRRRKALCLVGRRVGVAQRTTNQCTVSTPLVASRRHRRAEQLAISGPVRFDFTRR